MLLAALAPLATHDAHAAGDRDARRARAGQRLEVYSRLQKALPRLTPEQAAWLDTRRRDGAPARELQASDAWHIENARRHVGYLTDALRRIREGGFGARREMALWSYVVVLQGDYAFWDSLVHLVDVGELDPAALPGDLQTPRAGFARAVLTGHEDLMEIVIPWLQSAPAR